MPLLIILLVLVASPAYAQIEDCPSYRRAIDEIVNSPGAIPPAAVDRLVDIGQSFGCFSLYAAGLDRLNQVTFRDLVRRFESARTDKQSGTTAGGAGSTSLVAQGPTAKVLSVAAEYGALTQTVSSQVVTVRGNLAGLPSALVRQNVFPYCVGAERTAGYCVGRSFIGLLRHVSFAVSFDTTRSKAVTATATTAATTSAQPVTFTANRRDISGWSARLDLWNKRDTATTEFADAFQKAFAGNAAAAVSQAADDLLKTAGDLGEKILNAPGHDAWRGKHRAAILAGTKNRANVVAALHAALAELLPIAQGAVPELQPRAAATLASYSRFFLAQDELIDTLATRKVVALEYTNNQPLDQPATSNGRFVLDWPLNARTKVVANAGVTLYERLPADRPEGLTHYRDAQVAVQLEQALGRTSILGPATFSIAGYYQYQHAPALLTVNPSSPVSGVNFVGLPNGAKTVFATKGSIGLFQAKLTLAPEGSSMKVPVSVTYSNRTELIDKPTWRGQVGLSYDFDSLLGALSPR